jgi:hypothetical protein
MYLAALICGMQLATGWCLGTPRTGIASWLRWLVLPLMHCGICHAQQGSQQSNTQALRHASLVFRCLPFAC